MSEAKRSFVAIRRYTVKVTTLLGEMDLGAQLLAKSILETLTEGDS